MSSKLDVLLVYPPYNWRANPPLGLAYIASHLRQVGASVRILDMTPSELAVKDVKAVVQETCPALVGISFMTTQVGSARALARAAKDASTGCKVVVGGPHASALPREVLEEEPSIDFAVVGEGELTTAELLDAVKACASDFGDVAGLCWRSPAGIVHNSPRGHIEDVDRLGMPAWDLLPVDRYGASTVGGDARSRTFAILSSRGCPNHCIFCDSHSVFGRTFRGRSAENVFNEIMFLHKRYGARQVDFVDDTVTIDRRRLSDLCDMLIRQGVPVKWMANARVDTMSRELAFKMKRAGCVRLDFGVESGSAELRRKLNKNITDEQIRNAHSWAREAGIIVTSFFIVGTPWETWKTVEATARLINELDVDYPGLSVATPFPGTAMYRIAVAKGLLEVTDWERFETVPHLASDYRPVMRAFEMSSDDIMKAYYWLNSRLIRRKLATKYGRFFWLNPHMFRDKVFEIRRPRDLAHKLRMTARYIAGRFTPSGNGARRHS